jgi:hypothetical protein
MLGAQALIRLLAQHASAYAQLGAAAAAEYRGVWVRRIVLVLVAALTGMAGLAALWATGLIALWNTPWRIAYVGISAGLLIAVAGFTLWAALSRKSPGPSAGVLKAELQKDMELFHQWKSTL